jgi:uncharacterized protein YutE (UPF0331/DUF86 family)
MTQHHDIDVTPRTAPEGLIPRMRAYFTTLPDVRLAYYQPGPAEDRLALSGPDTARVVVAFTRSISGSYAEKRLEKIRRHFKSADGIEFLDIERIDYREACELAFNAQPAYGSQESIERDRLYRYNVFLEWNAGRKMTGARQELPPVLAPPLERPLWVTRVEQFVTPIYRHLKMMEGHLRELRRLTALDLSTFSGDGTHKSLAESLILKGVQSAIHITMSVMHRTMRLSARDYRDLFLHMPVFGITHRERAAALARAADIRDRMMFQYEDVTATEVYQSAFEIIDTLADFKSFMLEWVFDHYYAPTGELISHE